MPSILQIEQYLHETCFCAPEFYWIEDHLEAIDGKARWKNNWITNSWHRTAISCRSQHQGGSEWKHLHGRDLKSLTKVQFNQSAVCWRSYSSFVGLPIRRPVSTFTSLVSGHSSDGWSRWLIGESETGFHFVVLASLERRAKTNSYTTGLFLRKSYIVTVISLNAMIRLGPGAPLKLILWGRLHPIELRNT